MRPNVVAVDIKAFADEHRPQAGVGLWRTCSPTYTVTAAVAAVACVVLLNLLLVGELSFFFDLCFVVICLGAGLMVRPGEAWNVALVPPLLLVGTVVFLALISPGTVAASDDSTMQAMITGVTSHSGALLCGYLAFGVALWSGNTSTEVQAWDDFEDIDSAEPDDLDDAPEEVDQPSNLVGSPAPTRSTSG